MLFLGTARRLVCNVPFFMWLMIAMNISFFGILSFWVLSFRFGSPMSKDKLIPTGLFSSEVRLFITWSLTGARVACSVCQTSQMWVLWFVLCLQFQFWSSESPSSDAESPSSDATIIYGLSTEMHSNKIIRLWKRRSGLTALFYFHFLTCKDLWSEQECCRWRCSLLRVGSPTTISFDIEQPSVLISSTIGHLWFIT